MEKSCVAQLAPELRVYSLIGAASSHLVVRNGRSVLIDCHSGQLDRWLDRRGLPRPDLILHTHVQPEHCREADRFPEARLRVHEKLVELASDRPAYDRASRTTWTHPEEWPVTLGAEPYGVAGSVTVFPPDQPLPVTGSFAEGEIIPWQDLTFTVLSLPGHGRHPVGFELALDGVALAVFTGDLLMHPARLVNLYDMETHYGGTTLFALPAVLRGVAARPATRYFPATGPVIADGPDQARRLASAIEDYRRALSWKSGLYRPEPQPDYPRAGRFIQLHRGIYQRVNGGNCIVLIDDEGHGLMVDPGPCDYELPARTADFHRDLDYFEAACGLKAIDLILVTHMHGDHYDLAPEVQRRYPGCRLAAWDLVARVIEAPWDYPYAGLLPWYNLGFDHVRVDDVLSVHEPYGWHGVSIRTLHFPGHCYCHAAYLFTFNGLRLAFTGDTIQSRGDSVSLSFFPSNHSVPDARSGLLKAVRQLCAEKIDLNLGAHGSHFTGCAEFYAESLRRIEHAQPYLHRLIGGEDWEAAFLRPSFPRWPTWEVSSEGRGRP